MRRFFAQLPTSWFEGQFVIGILSDDDHSIGKIDGGVVWGKFGGMLAEPLR